MIFASSDFKRRRPQIDQCVLGLVDGKRRDGTVLAGRKRRRVA